MGKGDKRGKGKKMTMPTLQAIPRRQPNGQRRQRAPLDDPREVALNARCRLLGKPETRAERYAASAEYLGSGAGRAMAHERKHEQARRLWAVWQGYCAAERAYRARYIGQSGHPRGMTLELAPEPVETDQSHSVDTRTQEERDRAAVSAWMMWQGLLGMLPSARDASVIRQAYDAPDAVYWSEQTPTVTGYRFAEVMKRLADIVEMRS